MSNKEFHSNMPCAKDKYETLHGVLLLWNPHSSSVDYTEQSECVQDDKNGRHSEEQLLSFARKNLATPAVILSVSEESRCLYLWQSRLWISTTLKKEKTCINYRAGIFRY